MFSRSEYVIARFNLLAYAEMRPCARNDYSELMQSANKFDILLTSYYIIFYRFSYSHGYTSDGFENLSFM